MSTSSLLKTAVSMRGGMTPHDSRLSAVSQS